MRRHHTGSGRRAVIPADWETSHRVVVEGTLRGRVSLRIPGTQQTWSEPDQSMVTTPIAPYATNVPARVLELNGEAKTIRTGEDTEITVDFLVVVADRADVAAGHIVTVTSANDGLLVTIALRIQHVGVGTERFERDLFCTYVD